MASAFMVQGAGSNVGKSLLVAGLCRLFASRGLRVRPFKPQNMSNNAAVSLEGGEIGRAQALQARACGVAPSIHMNPVLLKPETDKGAQIIVRGQQIGSMDAREYTARKAEFLPYALESLRHLQGESDLVIIEGAGSPAEVNLRLNDIANMGFAEAADVPVLIAGDIDRGGVIASLVGTHAVLPEAEAARIKGFIINKFRGDMSLFAEGMTIIEAATGWQGLGIVPWFEGAKNLPAEDILDLENLKSGIGNVAQDNIAQGEKSLHVAVPILRRIANADDLDPLAADPLIRLSLVEAGHPLPMDADLVLIPGSKTTIADMAFMREQGWDIDIAALRRQGASIIGLCGGYQMLGRRINDPEGIEGMKASIDGLGLLDVETWLGADKTVQVATGEAVGDAGGDAGGIAVSGYEIHLGETKGEDTHRPMLMLDNGNRSDGAISADGRVQGCYMHGLFANDAYRAYWVKAATGRVRDFNFDALVDDSLDDLAHHLEQYLDIKSLERLFITHPSKSNSTG